MGNPKRENSNPKFIKFQGSSNLFYSFENVGSGNLHALVLIHLKIIKSRRKKIKISFVKCQKIIEAYLVKIK